MPSPLSEVTVLIDTREQRPLLFPAWIDFHQDRTVKSHPIHIKTKRITMPAGDYTIEGYDHICIVETKRSLRELHKNVCTKDWAREARALKRLSEACEHPCLLWEMTPSELFRQSSHVSDPRLVFDKWMQAIARFNLQFMFASGTLVPGSRRKLGEQMIRLMLAYVFNPPMENDPWNPEFRKEMWDRAPTWQGFKYKDAKETDNELRTETD